MHDYSKDYLTLSILEDNTTLNIGAAIGEPDGPPAEAFAFNPITFEYSTDKENWISVTSSSEGTSFGPFNAGTEVYLRGNNTTLSSKAYDKYYCCNCNFKNSTGKFNVKGNIMSLLDSTGFTTATTLNVGGEFSSLFYDCKALLDASKLILPATTLTEKCYSSMFYYCINLSSAPKSIGTVNTIMPTSACAYTFYGCRNLTAAPELPASTLANYCYRSMFSNCTSLPSAPELPATTLANYCYQSMFHSCTSLTTAPELPATILANNCYQYMFQQCAGLTTAPALPATTLAENCYAYMFNECISLNYIKCLATNISASLALDHWVELVAASGTFVKKAGVSWPSGDSGIPNGWAVQEV